MENKTFNNVINYAILPLIIILMFFTSNTNIINDIIKILIYIIICIPILKERIKERAKVNYLDFFLFVLLLSICIISSFVCEEPIKYINVFSQLLCFYYIIQYYKPQKSNINTFYFTFVILGTIWQFYNFKTNDNRAYLSSVGDPNYSGYYLFLWTCLASLSQKWILTILIVIISFKTYSRNYFLAILVFLLLRVGKINKLVTRIIDKLKLSFCKLSVISIVFVLLLGHIFLSNVDISSLSNVNNMETYKNRFTSFIDGSNYYRFYANEVFIDELKNNFSRYILGYDDILYKSTIFNVPHNAFLLGMLRYGISFIIYFILYSRIVDKKVFIKALGIYIPVFIYISILGLGLSGIDIILLAILVKIYEKRISEVKIEK